MRIPDSFFAAQAAAMQDKVFERLETITSTGELGGVYETPGEAISSHACNVQIVSDKLLAEEYGLAIGRDILVTARELPIEKGEYIRYAEQAYRVIEAPRYDAYQKLIAKRVST
jgi:hypothetical protein